MKIIEPAAEIITPINGREILKHIELCGRVCYKSEDRITDASAETFCKNIVKSGHEAVLEHYSITVRFICDRGISHEIVRHRLASYCQESTRYCNYSKDKFGGEITVIRPEHFVPGSDSYEKWKESCMEAEHAYFCLLRDGKTPQEARSVLPSSLKTELIMTANLREWRHFFRLRCSASAHPQIRQIAIPLLKEFKEEIPVVFDDLETRSDEE